MPRKKIITRKVRRLTPREKELILSGAVAFKMEIEDGNRTERYEKEQLALQGLYKHLAIIVEEEQD